MRPVIGIVLLILAAIGLAMYANHLHPGGELPPVEVQAEQDRQKRDEAQAKADKMKAMVDHSAGAFDAVKAGAIHATLVLTGKSPIEMEFYPVAAPKTVEHIVMLIKKGFYTGIKIHRVEDGSKGLKLFQFGDPESAKTDTAEFETEHIGSHGSGATVPLEVKLPHVKYAIGMARAEGEDTGDSQIYVNTDDNPNLDGNYCIFGRVVGGQDVLLSIKVGDVIKSFTIQ